MTAPQTFTAADASDLHAMLITAQDAGDTELADEIQCAIDGDPSGLEHLLAERDRDEAEADAAYRYEAWNRREWGIDQSEAWRDAYRMTPVRTAA